MDRTAYTPFVNVLIAGSGFLLLSASAFANEPIESPSPYVSARLVKAWLEEDRPVTFLDVREPDEFAAGHLPVAINVVYDQVATLADRLPHDQPIVVYCIHSAHRAPEAAKTLRTLGFDNAHVLEGGIVAWHAGGLTILASNPAQAPMILPKTERCGVAKTP